MRGRTSPSSTTRPHPQTNDLRAVHHVLESDCPVSHLWKALDDPVRYIAWHGALAFVLPSALGFDQLLVVTGSNGWIPADISPKIKRNVLDRRYEVGVSSYRLSDVGVVFARRVKPCRVAWAEPRRCTSNQPNGDAPHQTYQLVLGTLAIQQIQS